MSPLGTAVEEYLALRRGLGFSLRGPGARLRQFVAFMAQRRTSTITTRLALAWAHQPTTVQPAEWARRLSFVRICARDRHATDPRTEIPPDGLLPDRPQRARDREHPGPGRLHSPDRGGRGRGKPETARFPARARM